jgi:hypothetical protein
MHERNKSPKVLSDVALERVMRDVLSGIWKISPQRTQQEAGERNSPQSDGKDGTEGNAT